jgi:hypothetical protein
MANRLEFQQLALKKIDEAKALLAAGFPEGSHYLAGYVLSFPLKRLFVNILILMISLMEIMLMIEYVIRTRLISIRI